MDMLEVLHAKKAQSLVSDQDYRLTLHKYTTLPDDLKVQAAKKAYALQSEVMDYSRLALLLLILIVHRMPLEHILFMQQKIYRSDLNYLRGAAWIATGALQIEGSKRATDLISEVWMPIQILTHWSSIFICITAQKIGFGKISKKWQ